MLQGLTGYCSMPGMTAVAVAWRNQPSGVPGGVNWFSGMALLVLLDPRAGRGGGGVCVCACVCVCVEGAPGRG